MYLKVIIRCNKNITLVDAVFLIVSLDLETHVLSIYCVYGVDLCHGISYVEHCVANKRILLRLTRANKKISVFRVTGQKL